MKAASIDYVISTSSKGRLPTLDCVKIRRKAVERSIPCLTSVDTANAVADLPEEPVLSLQHRAGGYQRPAYLDV